MAIQDTIKNKIQQTIKDRIAQKVAPQKTASGFFDNLKQDVVDFGKGILYLAREPLVNPREVQQVTKEGIGALAKSVPKGFEDMTDSMGNVLFHPVDTTKKLVNDVSKLRDISYEQQKVLLNNTYKQINENNKLNKGEKALATVGAGIMGQIGQEISHPLDFAYEKPFTFGLDLLNVGGTKVLSKGIEAASKISPLANVSKKIAETFTPFGKLKNSGYGEFADDLADTVNKINNVQKRTIENTANKFEKVFNMSSKERNEFFDIVDSARRNNEITVSSTNPKIQQAIDWWIGEEVPNLQKLSGIQGEYAIRNYLHHFFPENFISKTEETSSLIKKQPFLSTRKYLEESKDVAGFSKDPVVSISAIKSRVQSDVLKDMFLKRNVQKYGKTVDDLEPELASKIGWGAVDQLKSEGKLEGYLMSELGFEKFNPGSGSKFFNNSISEDAKNLLYPKEIAEELNNLYKPYQENAIFSLLDAFNRNWKPLATSVRPRYHTRNVVGNIWNSVVLGKMDLKNIPEAAISQFQSYIKELQTHNSIAGNIFRRVFPEIGDTKFTEYMKLALENDVVGRGFFGADLHDMAKIAQTSDDIIKQINNLNNPAEIYKVPVLRQWLQISQNVGSALEDNARLALFIDRLKKGDSVINAKKYVNKYLFDYLTGLSDADKTIKKLFPFWAWKRFNIPLQLEGLAENSLKYAITNKIATPMVAEVERKDELKKYLTDNEVENGMLKIGETEKNGTIYNKYIRTDSVLPINDLSTITDIISLDPDQLGLNPLLTLGMRINSNIDYFGNIIEKFSGEKGKFLGGTFNKKTINVFQMIPILTEINKLIGWSYNNNESPDWKTRIEQVISPIGINLKNKEDLETFGSLKKQAEIDGSYSGGLKTIYKNYLIKSKNNPEEKVYLENVKRIEQLLKEEGLTDLNLLPIKIDAIKESLQETIKDRIKKSINQNIEDKKENDKTSLLRDLFGIETAEAAMIKLKPNLEYYSRADELIDKEYNTNIKDANIKYDKNLELDNNLKKYGQNFTAVTDKRGVSRIVKPDHYNQQKVVMDIPENVLQDVRKNAKKTEIVKEKPIETINELQDETKKQSHPDFLSMKTTKEIVDSTNEYANRFDVVINGRGGLDKDIPATRNNNPGNLKFAKQYGSIGSDGEFAKFKTPQDGYAAAIRQVRVDQTRNMSVREFVTKYAPPKDKYGNIINDTELYIKTVSKNLGVKENKNIKDIDTIDLTNEMILFESQTLVK